MRHHCVKLEPWALSSCRRVQEYLSLAPVFFAALFILTAGEHRCLCNSEDAHVTSERYQRETRDVTCRTTCMIFT
eukprot:1786841-Amphidinium_carterae.2